MNHLPLRSARRAGGDPCGFFRTVALLGCAVILSTCRSSPPTGGDIPDVPPPCDWTTASLQSQGIDSTLVGAAESQFRSSSYVESFVLVRNGLLVQEQYYTTAGILTSDGIASVTKSFISALVGIALKAGYLDSVGQKLMDFFPEYATPDLDSAKYRITVEDLLTMRAGFDYDEEANYSSLFNSGTNWMKEAIEFPMKWEPGDTFNYSSMDADLVSGILTKASKMSTYTLAKADLLDPLGVSVLNWPHDPQGYYFGGSGIVMYPRDLAKFGYLYVNGGSIDGKSIIPPEWVKNSTSPHLYQLNSWGDFKRVSYGYYWWTAVWKTDSVFMAVGYGGQLIVCDPSLNTVVVVTCNLNCSTAEASARHLTLLNIISKNVLAAVKN